MTILITLAVLIILSLASVAAYYLIKLQKSKIAEQAQIKENHLAWLEHKNTLIKDIKFIANSMLQQQCEITEGCMRLGYLIPKVDESETFKLTFPAIFEHYSLTTDMPIKDAYQALSRKEQFKLDSKRLTLEAKNKEPVLSNCQTLLKHTF